MYTVEKLRNLSTDWCITNSISLNKSLVVWICFSSSLNCALVKTMAYYNMYLSKGELCCIRGKLNIDDPASNVSIAEKQKSTQVKIRNNLQ